MSTTRVIRKYPNRRLYDTRDSRYIKLSDIRDLVVGKIEFAVIDKKSGNDITRAILLQVISEQEQHGDAIMSQAFLSQVIRSYAEVASGSLSNYLEQSLMLFLNQQQHCGQVKKTGTEPATAGADSAKNNFTRWKSLQDEVHRRFNGGALEHNKIDQEQLPPEQKKASQGTSAL